MAGLVLTLISILFLCFEERAATYDSEVSSELQFRRPKLSVNTILSRRNTQRAQTVLPTYTITEHTSPTLPLIPEESDDEKSIQSSATLCSIQRPEIALSKPHRKATDGLPGSDCPICLERKLKLSDLPCGHVFCTEYVRPLTVYMNLC